MKIRTLIEPLISLGNTYSIDDILNNNEILLFCTGQFDDAACDRHLMAAEAQVVSIMEERKLQKRLFYIIVESIQNISRHKSVTHTITDRTEPLLLVGKQNEMHYVLTANPIQNSRKDSLIERMDAINRTGAGDMRKLYQETLNSGKFNVAGGANLGLIDIARKAGGKLQYGFDRIDDDHCYFILKIDLDKN